MKTEENRSICDQKDNVKWEEIKNKNNWIFKKLSMKTGEKKLGVYDKNDEIKQPKQKKKDKKMGIMRG